MNIQEILDEIYRVKCRMVSISSQCIEFSELNVALIALQDTCIKLCLEELKRIRKAA